MRWVWLAMCAALTVALAGCVTMKADSLATGAGHAVTEDYPVTRDAYLWGFTRNLVVDTVEGKQYPVISIQSANLGERLTDFSEHRGFSCWARDVYWGCLGWTQAGGEDVTGPMKSTIQLFLISKARNRADGSSKPWPNADGRYYIPQAFTPGATCARDFYPYDAESQAHFVLMVELYLRMTGDSEFVREIWDEVTYVMETVRLMDTNGNALPDFVWGSYDYQGVGPNTEEPLMCATAAAAFRAYADMAASFGYEDAAGAAREHAEAIKQQMNKPVEEGGLWKADGNPGYYVNMRHTGAEDARVDDRFIPYENTVPVFFGMTSQEQTDAIYARLDAGFNDYYLRKHGPMYVAHLAATNDMTVEDVSTTPWLGFLDVYLRSKTGAGSELNRRRILALLLAHAYDVAETPFSEGLGIYGSITGGAGRSWDNGNFFHCLINGIYGIEKTYADIRVSAPKPVPEFAFKELRSVPWRNAIYDFEWQGRGTQIASVRLDGRVLKPSDSGDYVIADNSGRHTVLITLE